MAIGTIFALLDAYNIGANDVANSFATSVASKSLTMKQAALAASVMEFAGAVAVGARTADTIKSGVRTHSVPRRPAMHADERPLAQIISASAFEGNAGVQLLAFVCAIVVSGTWLMICTRLSWPVSTTVSSRRRAPLRRRVTEALLHPGSTRLSLRSLVSVSLSEVPMPSNGDGTAARVSLRKSQSPLRDRMPELTHSTCAASLPDSVLLLRWLAVSARSSISSSSSLSWLAATRSRTRSRPDRLCSSPQLVRPFSCGLLQRFRSDSNPFLQPS